MKVEYWQWPIIRTRRRSRIARQPVSDRNLRFLCDLCCKLSCCASRIPTSLINEDEQACEVPSTIYLKKLRPARFISGIAILWGIIASLTGLTQNYGSLIACRLLLGLAEGPLFPCMILYLTFFYTRKELAVRFGYLIIGAAVAGAVGGLLAYAIGYMDGVRNLRAWRW